jgi:hypothetical protein
MSFKHTVFLNNESYSYDVTAYMPLDLEIDPNNLLSSEEKVYKIKYSLNGEVFHVQLLNVADFENGDPRNTKIVKKFLYDPEKPPTSLLQTIKIEVYAMTIPNVWEYFIYVALQYPSINDIENNIFFENIKLVKTHIISDQEMVYIFESESKKIDDLTLAEENERFLFPVKVKWLNEEESRQIEGDSIYYDYNPYTIQEPFIKQIFDTEDTLLKQDKNDLSPNEEYTIKNDVIVKTSEFANIKTIKLQRQNLPEANKIPELENSFTFQCKNLFSENSKNKKFKYNFLTKEEVFWEKIDSNKEGVLIYIPNSYKLKDQNIFKNKIFDGDMGSVIEKNSKFIFRIKKINREFYKESLSKEEKMYINDLYVLYKN